MHNSINHVLSRAMNNFFAILLWIIKAVNLFVRHVTAFTDSMVHLRMEKKTIHIFCYGEARINQALQV